MHIVHSNGDQEWRISGKDGVLVLHRTNDLPAVIRANGDQEWYFLGRNHRGNDLPAVIRANGDQEWHFLGRYHRDNGLPAVILANGDQAWYHHGNLHQNNGQPAVIRANGCNEWHYFGIRTSAAIVDKINQAQIAQNCRLLLDPELTATAVTTGRTGRIKGVHNTHTKQVAYHK